MIRSMTAFAAKEQNTAFGQLTCELRSVNHRYLELSIRLPEELRAFEGAIREKVSAKISRGKVDLSLRLRSIAAASVSLQLNEALAAELARLSSEMLSHNPNLKPSSVVEALAWPGMITEATPDRESLQGDAMALLEASLDEFVQAREREGDRLAGFMLERVDGIENICAQVREWLPEIRLALRAKLDAKVADLAVPLEPGRLEQEWVMGFQKLDVDEELDRLTAHLAEARRILSRDESAGRRLDFLLQEFNREVNTLGSKSVDTRTSQASVELKVLIEQIREQVQNVE